MYGLKRLTTAKLSLLFAAGAVVCLAQMPPIDSSNYAAKVVTLTGQVSVLKDSEPWALVVGDTIQVKQLIMTGPDGQATFKVSDGSTFDVYPNSRVVFRKNAPNWKDLLDVLVGRVKVHIEHLYGPNPNRVLTPTAVISVRGTTFDISVADDDETTLVEVEEGTVEVQHALLPRGNARILTTGESLRVYRNEPIAQSGVDKRMIAQRALRMIVDAVSTYETRMPRAGSIGGSTSSSGGGGIGSGSTPKPAPPTSAPTAPPPPPPPGYLGGSHIDLQGGSPPPEGRFHHAMRVTLHVIERFVLGVEPGADVLQALQP
jgi:hypothetical protein